MTLSVSIITPSLNQARFVKRTIDSVLGQGIPGLDYIVVDGGSHDGTIEVVRRFEGRLRWLSEPDRGQAHAVNKGVQSTDGDVVGWLNSDDTYFPGAIAVALAFLESNPEIDFVYGNAQFVDEHDAPIQMYHTESWNLARLFNICYICQPSVFIRRRAFERFGLLDESLTYCLDYEYWLRAGLAGAAFGHVPRLLATYRIHPATKSVGSKVALHTEINDMLRRKLGRTPDAWLREYGIAVADQQGARPAKRVRHALFATALSFYAGVRWNRSLTISHLATSLRWIASSARLSIRVARDA